MFVFAAFSFRIWLVGFCILGLFFFLLTCPLSFIEYKSKVTFKKIKKREIAEELIYFIKKIKVNILHLRMVMAFLVRSHRIIIFTKVGSLCIHSSGADFAYDCIFS